MKCYNELTCCVYDFVLKSLGNKCKKYNIYNYLLVSIMVSYHGNRL